MPVVQDVLDARALRAAVSLDAGGHEIRDHNRVVGYGRSFREPCRQLLHEDKPNIVSRGVATQQEGSNDPRRATKR